MLELTCTSTGSGGHTLFVRSHKSQRLGIELNRPTDAILNASFVIIIYIFVVETRRRTLEGGSMP
jgi:hypothetical protein